MSGRGTKRVAAAAILLGLSSACEAPGSGLEAWLRVEGASFVDAPLPGAAGGPKILGLDLSRSRVRAGEVSHPLNGAMEPSARGALLALEGDRGHWILPAGLPDVSAPDAPTFQAKLSFAPEVPSGPRGLTVAAVDAEARPGPSRSLALTVATSSESFGAFAIVLRWDGPADLDLHVVPPDGDEIWSGAPSGLDGDVHAGCAREGRQAERVVYEAAPPAGVYLARVDVPSLCGASVAYWSLEVRRGGVLGERAVGVMTGLDVRAPHERGSGVLALTVEP